MTIKEIEQLVGMTRANIRFYESERLLEPARNKNGYREYTEKEVDVLMKIKLLRNLQISLEEIKRLHCGEHELDLTLREHLEYLNIRSTEIEQSKIICEEIQKEGVSYQKLDDQKYLPLLKAQGYNYELKSDVVNPIPMPARRFFARMFDYHLYQCLFYIFLAVVCNKNVTMLNSAESFFYTFILLVMMLIFESVLLSVWGTTLGKWILGITVLDTSENRLSFSDSAYRTVKVMWYGMGLNIPIYNIVRGIKSYTTCSNNQVLPWDEDIILERKDRKIGRVFAYMAAVIVMSMVLVLAVNYAEMPKNRGDITIEEFQENYDEYVEYNKLTVDKFEKENTYNSVIDLQIEMTERPVFSFEEENGFLKAVKLELYVENSKLMVSSYQDEMILSVLSFAHAKDDRFLPSEELKEIVTFISEHSFEDFEFETD